MKEKKPKWIENYKWNHKNTESETSIRIQFHSFIFRIFLWAFVLALKWLFIIIMNYKYVWVCVSSVECQAIFYIDSAGYVKSQLFDDNY